MRQQPQTIRFPPELHDEMIRLAKQNNRSVSQQVIAMLLESNRSGVLKRIEEKLDRLLNVLEPGK